MSISPIITLNSGAIQEVEAIDIIKKISDYSSGKGVFEDAKAIPLDMNLLSNDIIMSEIHRQNVMGSVDGFSVGAVKDGDNGIDLENSGDEKRSDKTNGGSQNGKDQLTNGTMGTGNNLEEDSKTIEKKFATYYSRVLFYAFLTEDELISLKDILDGCEKENNKRILRNLGLQKNVLEQIQENMNPFKLSQLDNAIYKSNYRSFDETLSPLDRVKIAVKKFERFSETEVQTREEIVMNMIETIEDESYIDMVKSGKSIFDMASTVGEFTIGIYQKLLDLGIETSEFEDLIVSVPSSSIAYEFIRKIYGILGLNDKMIVSEFIASDLVDSISDSENLTTSLDAIKTSEATQSIYSTNGVGQIGLIIGNPPYDKADGGSGRSSTPIYNYMVELAKRMEPQYICFVIPAKWYSGGKWLNEFRKDMISDRQIKRIDDYENAKDVFPVDLPGGVCQFLWEKGYAGLCTVINNGDESTKEERQLDKYVVFVRRNKDLKIVEKVVDNNKIFLKERVSARNPFGLPTNYKPMEEGVPCWFIQKIGKKAADQSDVNDKNGILSKWKLLAPKSPIAGQTDFTKPVGFYTHRNTILAEPGECCTDSYIVLGAFDSKEEVESYRSYIFTKIVRFLLLQAVVSQDVTSHCYIFVPDVEKYDHTFTDEELIAKWKISEDEWRYIDSRIKDIS